MNCYVCDTKLIQENRTLEHIILNAIGGKLKSGNLICRDCNSKFGSEIDNKLAEQLKPIATLLDVKRDKGKPQNVKVKHGSREIIIEPGGKMKLARAYKNIKEDGIYQIEAPTMGQARKVLEGLKRRNPRLNVEEELQKAQFKSDYLPSVTISMNFGGVDVKRAICKMAVNYYILNKGNVEGIKPLLPFIEGQEEKAEVYYFYPKTEVFHKGENEILHSLILKGDPLRKQLYVYIELFNEFKFIVFLSRNYEGDSIYESYHYNIITNEVLEYDIKVNILPRHLKKDCEEDINEAKFNERMRFLFQQIDKVVVSRKIHEITDSAMKEMCEKYPQEHNPFFTKEMLGFLSNRVVEQFCLAFQNRLVSE